MTSESLYVERDGARLAGEVWAGAGPAVVLLHAGVTDRRSWYEVADRLAPSCRVIAYDRRAFGSSPPTSRTYSHLDDLAAVLDQVADGPVWLVGSSMGGGLALDAAVSWPQRVAGLVLLAPAVSGSPEPDELDLDTQRLGDLLDAAGAAGDLDEVNRLEAWIWLDGPTSAEGRVSGPARALALDMNAIVLRHAVPEEAGESGVDAWSQLGQIEVPTSVVWGDLDLPQLVARCAELVERIPNATGRAIPGTAHLPYLERPDEVADLVLAAVSRAG